MQHENIITIGINTLDNISEKIIYLITYIKEYNNRTYSLYSSLFISSSPIDEKYYYRSFTFDFT